MFDSKDNARGCSERSGPFWLVGTLEATKVLSNKKGLPKQPSHKLTLLCLRPQDCTQYRVQIEQLCISTNYILDKQILVKDIR